MSGVEKMKSNILQRKRNMEQLQIEIDDIGPWQLAQHVIKGQTQGTLRVSKIYPLIV